MFQIFSSAASVLSRSYFLFIAPPNQRRLLELSNNCETLWSVTINKHHAKHLTYLVSNVEKTTKCDFLKVGISELLF